jgi:phosphoribosylaminoimidazole carboxylase PurE protein
MKKQGPPKIAIIMGSKSDYKVMSKALEAIHEFGLEAHVEIVSAHRTPDRMYEFATKSESQGIKVIVAGAGGAAHLPGMVASLTTLPVIGVPVNVTKLKGLDSLLSIVQMPKGVPVATVAIDNAYNAGLLAVKILATSDAKLSAKLSSYQKKQSKKISMMNQEIKSETKKKN